MRRPRCLRSMGALLLVITWLVSSPACRRSAPPAPGASAAAGASTGHRLHFTDVTGSSGLAFALTAGRVPSTQIVEVKGGGLALIDFDNDGDLDVFVPNGATLDDPEHGPGCRLFENQGDLRFRDVTAAAGLTHRRWSLGVAVGDVDGNGFDDLYIACFGPNVLLRNTGAGGFEEVPNAGGADDARLSTSAAFGDLDGDGDLDLYVTNYLEFDPAQPPPPSTFKTMQVFAGPMGLPPEDDVLYLNDGSGAFRDLSAAAGCRPEPPAYGLNVVIVDFDGDGRADILVGNDSTPNFLFHNLGTEGGEPRFEEIGLASGIASNLDGSNQATMGIAVGDVDGNGFPDVFSTNFSSDTNTLHMNLDGTFFEDRTRSYGLGMVSRPFLGWACGLYDFDHDADEDLLIVNGHVYPQASWETMDSPYLQAPLLFERHGPRFRRARADDVGPWLDEPHCDRSAAFGDLDGDGDIDVIIAELNGPLRLLRNDTPAGAGLIVELRDERPGVANRRGYGSCVEISGAGHSQRRWIFSGGSYQAASEAMAHFGLPSGPGATGPVQVEVTWPDGVKQVVPDVAPGRRVVVRRPPD